MANGSMPSWEEWNEQLTEEQRSYSLYKILESMNQKMAACPERLSVCNARFKKIEDRKKLDTGVSAGFGLGGGALAVFCKWLFGG